MIGTLLLAAAVSAAGGASVEPSSSGALCVSRLPGAIELESEGRGVAWSGYDDSEAARRRRTTHHTFHAPTGSGYRRATVDVTESAAPVERHAAVRLTVLGPSLFESSGPSPLSCSEANEQRPPFETCTANAGGGWDNGGPKDLLLAIDNLAVAAVTVDLQILVMDPLE